MGPTQEEIEEYAEVLGMDLKEDRDLFWIAREGLKAPIPAPWKPCLRDDDIFYFNFVTGVSEWEHPCDDKYRKLFQEAKEKKTSQIGKDSGNEKEAPATLFEDSSAALSIPSRMPSRQLTPSRPFLGVSVPAPRPVPQEAPPPLQVSSAGSFEMDSAATKCISGISLHPDPIQSRAGPPQRTLSSLTLLIPSSESLRTIIRPSVTSALSRSLSSLNSFAKSRRTTRILSRKLSQKSSRGSVIRYTRSFSLADYESEEDEYVMEYEMMGAMRARQRRAFAI